MAYALSQRLATLSLMDVTHDWKTQLLAEYSKDMHACEILDGMHGDDRLRVMDDVIHYKDRIYLVLESQLKENIMQAAHDFPLAGHLGEDQGHSRGVSHGGNSRRTC